MNNLLLSVFSLDADSISLNGIALPDGLSVNKSGLILYIVAARLSYFPSHQKGTSINVIPINSKQGIKRADSCLSLYKDHFLINLADLFL